MVQTATAVSVTNPLYDDLMFKPLFLEFYDQSHFGNYGYWEPDTKNLRQACQNLSRKLLERMPEKSGAVLDVACGKGATTQILAEHFSPENITAINISERQLETGRWLVPGADFRVMDATRLGFPDNAFRVVQCVEAAFHFDTRRKFLEEAYRVLEPGGALVMSDILMTREAEQSRPYRSEANYLPGPEEYAQLLRELGYREIRIDDVTEECWRSFFRHLVAFLHEKFLRRQISEETLKQHLDRNYRHVFDLEYYLLVAARK